MRKHQRPWVIAFSKAPFKSRKPLWKWCHKGSPDGWFYLHSFWPSGSCPSRLIMLNHACFFYPSSHQGISHVLFSCKARKDSRCFPGRRAGEVSAARDHHSWCSVSEQGTSDEICVRSWVSQQQCESHPCFPSMCGALGKRVALLAIYLLETFLVQSVLYWELYPWISKNHNPMSFLFQYLLYILDLILYPFPFFFYFLSVSFSPIPFNGMGMYISVSFSSTSENR